MKITGEEIEQLKDSVDENIHYYLRQNGWEQSCQNPLSVWLWEKTIKGKRFTLDRNTAYEMQLRLEELEKL